MTIVRVFVRTCLLLVVSVSAFAQRPAETVSGNKALRFDAGENFYSLIIQQDYKGEPALKFWVHHYFNFSKPTFGSLYITATRIAYDPNQSTGATDAFDFSRSQVSSLLTPDPASPCYVTLFANKRYDLRTYFRNDSTNMLNTRCKSDAEGQRSTENLIRWIGKAYLDFPRTMREFESLVAPPRPKPVAPVPAAPPVRKKATLALLTTPGGVQVYLDNRFQGTTSEKGELIIDHEAGEFDLRLSLTGYKERKRAVVLQPGEKQTIEATLQPEGPKPLTRQDCNEMLVNKLPKARVIALIKQYGVDFALNAETEKELRASGADSDILVAIATNKK